MWRHVGLVKTDVPPGTSQKTAFLIVAAVKTSDLSINWLGSIAET
jgi:hypothetical protein